MTRSGGKWIKTLSLTADEPMADRVDAVANAVGVSKSHLLRMVVGEWLNSIETGTITLAELRELCQKYW
jgi:predicted DNA-binding protein